jgi:hypothetical protein
MRVDPETRLWEVEHGDKGDKIREPMARKAQEDGFPGHRVECIRDVGLEENSTRVYL